MANDSDNEIKATEFNLQPAPTMSAKDPFGARHNPTRTELGLAQVNEIAAYVARGDVTSAQEGRRTLNDLCAGQYDDSGELTYPQTIIDALRQAGLRTTPR